MNNTTEVLETALDLLIHKGWGQGQSFKESDEGDAVDYCLVGAVEAAVRQLKLRHEAATFAYNRLIRAYGNLDLVAYNDDSSTTKEDMLLLFKKAIHEHES